MHSSTPAHRLYARTVPSRSSRTLPWFAMAALLLSVCGAGTSFAAYGGPGDLVTPPPPPEVAPVISGTYPNDADGDGIDDALQDLANTAGSFSAQAASADNSVKVELVFTEPVTQQQIDAFIALGGQVSYMYKTVSYGWNGRIDASAIALLPDVMGPSLVLVKPVRKLDPYMDIATQNARVRPVWKPGFAGAVDGFDGDPNITIGIAVDGVDNIHPDLAGRCAYWSDLSDDRQPNPVDHFGHGTLAAGIAVGTGQADNLHAPKLRYTYNSGWMMSPEHVVDPITFAAKTYITVESKAHWFDFDADLLHIRWFLGSNFHDLDIIGRYSSGSPDQTLTNTYMASDQQVLSMLLVNWTGLPLFDVVITNTVSEYPAIDDGFSRLRGVAPACKWAAARLYDNWGFSDAEGLGPAIDDLVAHRKADNIKIVNISFGTLDDDGFPSESLALRNKVNSAVLNGVIVVAAAGNSADESTEAERVMADPARAALAITVGAANDENALTDYSAYGFTSPRSDKLEDYKPDIIAPGGSWRYSAIMSADSESSDGYGIPDRQQNDYANSFGTSFASPFVAGCAALVIDALQQQGTAWDFESDELPRFVKMVLCATATETGKIREDWGADPSVQRAASGPNGFPAAKDRYEGYGLINADAAVEAVWRTYVPRSQATDEFGSELADRRAWAAKINLIAGCGIDISLDNPSTGDFDLYLYSGIPSDTGTPIILAAGTRDGTGVDETISYTPDDDAMVLLVVKRVSGSGTFKIQSSQSGPPSAEDVSIGAGAGSDTIVQLQATDDGSPNPPGKLTYTIVSLPSHGRLQQVASGAAITKAPTKLAQGVDEVVYRPDAGYVGSDAFTFRASDGGTPPYGGNSNTATVRITIQSEVTVACQVAAGDDDAHISKWGTYQKLNDASLGVGQNLAGVRFTGVSVPQGAQIIKATLKICAHSGGLGGHVSTAVRAEDVDNVGPFDSDHRPNNVTTTDASVIWDWDASWSSDTWYDSPDLSAVIQEVVDRAGWSSGNAIALNCAAENYPSSDRKFWSYDGNPARAAKLEITYQP